MTYYDVLGVRRDAAVEEIRQAYLALARRHHPDVLADPADRPDAERRMQEVNEAWGVLGVESRRARYDRSLGPVPHSPSRPWQPLDDDDEDGEVDGGGAWERDLDLLDDEARGDGGLPTAVQVVPPLAVATGIVCLLVGGVTAIPGLSAIGAVALVLGGAAFLLFPLLAVHRSRRGERSVSASPDDAG